ncbi:MAG: helix-turn-helix transcriptional regulator [Lachnospiraceae bacterium]
MTEVRKTSRKRRILCTDAFLTPISIMSVSQKELSSRTGITQADISRIENGTSNPSLAVVKKLAYRLDM